MKLLTLAFLVAISALLLNPIVIIQDKGVMFSLPHNQSLENNTLSTVSVFSPGSGGSGFYINKNYIVTNHHVVGGSTDKVAISNRYGWKYNGTVIYRNKAQDVVLIYTETKGRPVTMYNFNSKTKLKSGDFIYSLGTNSYNNESAKTGRVAFIDKVHSEIFGDQLVIKTDVDIGPGYSGGPTFDANGVLVGINVGIEGTFTREYKLIILFDEVKKGLLEALIKHHKTIN